MENWCGGDWDETQKGAHVMRRKGRAMQNQGITLRMFALSVCFVEMQSGVQNAKAVDVSIKVTWPSKDAERKLPEDLESLGKMLARGTYKQIANAAW